MTDPPAHFDLITIGDSTIDTFIKVQEASLECSLNKRDCKICVPYGSKIPVDHIAYGVAGNAANVAVGAAKLGLKTSIYTNLGGDNQGHMILSAFEQNGVDTSFVNVVSDKASNLSVVLSFQGERTIFVYHQDWFYKLPPLPGCSWLYLTSMAGTFTNSNIMDEVHHYVEKTQTNLVYAPGTYQLKGDVKRYPKILEQCYCLIVNREEAQKILGIENSDFEKPHDLLTKMLFLGPKIIVITDGEDGSYATNGQMFLKAGVVPTKIVEKTGAGDAYSSAFIAALANGLELEEAMVWGTINASAVISNIGTQKGILTKEELAGRRKELGAFAVGNL